MRPDGRSRSFTGGRNAPALRGGSGDGDAAPGPAEGAPQDGGARGGGVSIPLAHLLRKSAPIAMSAHDGGGAAGGDEQAEPKKDAAAAAAWGGGAEGGSPPSAGLKPSLRSIQVGLPGRQCGKPLKALRCR